MYPRLTISNLTEGLRNVYTNKKSEGNTPISLGNPMENRCELSPKKQITADATPTAGVFTVSLERSTTKK
jgi:hypothetical protein